MNLPVVGSGSRASASPRSPVCCRRWCSLPQRMRTRIRSSPIRAAACPTAVGNTVTLAPGSYTADSGGTGFNEDSWYDCDLAPPRPAADTGRTQCPRWLHSRSPPRPPTHTVVTAADEGFDITVLRNDPDPLAARSTSASNPIDRPGTPSAPAGGSDRTRRLRRSPATVRATGSTLHGAHWPLDRGQQLLVQWFRCQSDGSSSCAPVSTSGTYLLTDADVGGILLLTDDATNTAAGFSAATSRSVRADHPARRNAPPPTRQTPARPSRPSPGTPQIGATIDRDAQ